MTKPNLKKMTTPELLKLEKGLEAKLDEAYKQRGFWPDCYTYELARVRRELSWRPRGETGKPACFFG